MENSAPETPSNENVKSDDQMDFFDHEPSRFEKAEMRRAIKSPSEWLKLLCKKWALENAEVVAQVDEKFVGYKSYLNGQLSSQLLCRLSMLASETESASSQDGVPQNKQLDFWAILGVDDEFDRNYIVAQIEKYCTLYSIRGGNAILDEESLLLGESPSGSGGTPVVDPSTLAGGLGVSPSTPGLHHFSHSFTHSTIAGIDSTAAAAAAAAAVVLSNDSKAVKKQQAEVNRAKRKAKDAEKALETERRLSQKKELQRINYERREQKVRQRDASNVRKAVERAAREANREERRRKKLETRQRRELIAQQQKEAALRRAAELVQSNRVPIEITRGAAVAAAANAAVAATNGMLTPKIDMLSKRSRSSIVVSTASDLNQIVTHSKNLWTKYNAIAKEHNQKVNWITVAKELGIHVKVREKYARMHARALQRGFDFVTCGHYKIKEHPQIFLEPLNSNVQSKKSSNDSIETHSTESHDQQKQMQIVQAAQHVEIEQAAAAAAAAAMKANGVNTEELVDGSVVANEIESTEFENNDSNASTNTPDPPPPQEGIPPVVPDVVVDDLSMDTPTTYTPTDKLVTPKAEVSV